LRELTNISRIQEFLREQYESTFIQESRMRENLTYGLTRGHGKQGLITTAPMSYSTDWQINENIAIEIGNIAKEKIITAKNAEKIYSYLCSFLVFFIKEDKT